MIIVKYHYGPNGFVITYKALPLEGGGFLTHVSWR